MEKIDLAWRGLTTARSDEVLMRLKAAPGRVLGVNLAGNDLATGGTRAVVQHFASKDENFVIEELNLANNNIPAMGAIAIASFLRSSKDVKVLCLPINNIGDQGAIVIAEGLKHHESLEELNLSYNGITKRGAIAIADALKHNKPLVKLDLTGNEIGDEGAKALANVLATLTDVSLSRNAITDDGAIACASALSADGCCLEQLRLASNDIAVTGAAALASSLRSNKILKTLDLRFNELLGVDGRKLVLEVLESNTSLTRCRVVHCESHPLQARLEYLTELNCHGREIARTDGVLLPLALEKATTRVDLIYGLLTEAPHVWMYR